MEERVRLEPYLAVEQLGRRYRTAKEAHERQLSVCAESMSWSS